MRRGANAKVGTMGFSVGIVYAVSSHYYPVPYIDNDQQYGQQHCPENPRDQR